MQGQLAVVSGRDALLTGGDGGKRGNRLELSRGRSLGIAHIIVAFWGFLNGGWYRVDEPQNP